MFLVLLLQKLVQSHFTPSTIAYWYGDCESSRVWPPFTPCRLRYTLNTRVHSQLKCWTCCSYEYSNLLPKCDFFFWAGWKVFSCTGHEFKIQANADFSTNMVITITEIYAMFLSIIARGFQLTFEDFVLWFRVEIDQLRVQFTPFFAEYGCSRAYLGGNRRLAGMRDSKKVNRG